ncbi:hypothetical protein V6N11_039855 [Hibiscus sabdariffa]|uniref:Uncharacterized protein n=1 Tax=Hibiscus sabdariffa TaxID=183260 RepID=A0ABR2RFQ3_9ROSI
MVRNGLPLSHLCFADDLVLYAKADVGQARVIKDILEVFCEHSGHRVSAQKSQVYFPPNTDLDQRDAVRLWVSLRLLPLAINWSTIAQPCNRGGLGIPRCYERNLAFMQKLAFQLVSSTESMWVTALRQKYRMLTTCPLSIARQNCSPLWCALANIWDSFRDNTFWLVGDATDVHLWNDTWAPSVGPLRPWLSNALPSVYQLHFEDMLHADGNWNVSRLSELLDHAVVPHVLGVLPPSFDAARDRVAWRLTPSGAFTVASAYEGFLSPSWDVCDPKWSSIWSLPVAQRVRMFLWLVLRQRLMTNVERVRRGLSSDPSCSSCGCYSETILHILRDCPPVRSFWKSIIPQVEHECFFGSSLDHWVAMNIKTSRAIGPNTPHWSCFFPSFLWQVWKRRNDVFTGECLPLSDIYRIGIVWASHFADSIPDVSVATHATDDFVQWVAPAHDWVWLNTDASVSLPDHLGSLGGVLRGSSGDWLRGYRQSVGVVPPLNAELWSILVGLQLAFSMGFSRVQVQSDSSAAIRLILDPMAANSVSSLVRRISSLQNLPWSLRFLWVPREMNMVADGLSKLSSLNDFHLQIFDDIPETIRPLLARDREGPPYRRRC